MVRLFLSGVVALVLGMGSVLPAGAVEVAKPNTAAPQGEPAVGKDWKLYKHPTGLSMRYPATWKLAERDFGLQLTPPDVATNDFGDAEAYLVIGQGADGITTPSDPRVVAFLEQQITGLVPFLQRVGEVENVKSATTPAVRLVWEGQNNAGKTIRAEVRCAILKGYGVAVLALGEKDLIKKRSDVVEGIAASFAAGAGQRDPALAGTWKYWSYTQSPDGKFSTEKSRLLALRADGTCTWAHNAESAASLSQKDSGGEEIWHGGAVGRSDNADQGTWTAANGTLFILWNDGSDSSWDYTLGGVAGNRRLFLKGKAAKPDEWVEAR